MQNYLPRIASLELTSSSYITKKENGPSNTHFKIEIAAIDENIVGIITTNNASNEQYIKYDILINTTKRNGNIADGAYSVIDRKGNAYGRKRTTSVRSKTTSLDTFSSFDIKDTVCDIAISVSDIDGIEGESSIYSSLINDINGAGGSFCIYIKKEENVQNND